MSTIRLTVCYVSYLLTSLVTVAFTMSVPAN